ncbi:ATP synthase mitochondrial F1 complex assembly factor 2-like isoform X2 [Portunus trituberculatus]|uniref:ATP synthase mitochondrial F1 complex assembly factor 2-like isoform X2 n=1 Tax=Portunus trituberculatus TaxID=210409 RepID=UPI001E1CD8C5|nr:ATP synthase mitochondrial F1 complex assembly factor 2-like isoform X2 [Portunus trituberculatus]
MFTSRVLSSLQDVFHIEQGGNSHHNMRGLWWPVAHQLLKQTARVTLPRRFLPEARRRFYKNVTVAGNGGIYEVNLDLHKLKTPKGHTLQIPNYGLALAVAQEWAASKDKIVPSLMHLTGLSYTVIDNPNHETKWDTVHKTLEYLDTDTLLFREESEELNTLQAKEWDPILAWFNQKFDADIKPCAGLFGADIPDPVRETIRRYLLSYDVWAVNGFLYGVEALKSVILTIAAAERKITAEKAAFLSRLELEYQTSHWGSVEWAHDLDKQEVTARFSAALLFIHFNTWQATTKHKAK